MGGALLVYGIVAVIAQGWLVRRSKAKPIVLLRIGMPIAIAGYALFVFADDFLLLTVALAVQGLGQGLLLPGVTAAGSLAVGDESQGSIAGLNSASTGIGRFAGPLAGGGLYELLRAREGVGPELTYAASGLLLGLVFLVVLMRPSVVSGPAEEQ